MTAVANTLTDPERQALATLEASIQGGLQTFVDVGTALLAIRDGRLYRESSPDFESYCQVRWGFTRRRAGQLIEAAAVVREIEAEAKPPSEPKNTEKGTVVPISPPALPTTERQARELAKVEPKKRAEVWKRAVETAPKDKEGKPKITAVRVRAVVKAKADPAEPEPAPEPAPADEEGHALPDNPGVREAFAGLPDFKKALSLHSQAVGVLNKLWESAAGLKLSPLRQRIQAHYAEARKLVTEYLPHAVCPECRGAKKACGRCGDCGWVTREAWKRMDDAEKARAGRKGAA